MVRALPDDATPVVDLGYTLHLGNSTEDIIDAVQPSTNAATTLAESHWVARRLSLFARG